MAMIRPRRRLALAALLALMLAAGACRKDDRVDGLVAQIKASQADVAALQRQVADLERRVAALEAPPPAPAAPVAATPPPAAPAADVATCAQVRLDDAAARKIDVIKTLRVVRPDLGLAAAKALVEQAPTIIADKLTAEQAEAIKRAMVESGATVSILPGPCP